MEPNKVLVCVNKDNPVWDKTIGYVDYSIRARRALSWINAITLRDILDHWKTLRNIPKAGPTTVKEIRSKTMAAYLDTLSLPEFLEFMVTVYDMNIENKENVR